jgi:RNA polymerase sigma-70 factor (ECF subfamily)
MYVTLLIRRLKTPKFFYIVMSSFWCLTEVALLIQLSLLKNEMAGFADSEIFKDLILTWPDRAIEYLYEHYHNSLVHIAERRTHDRKAAEDIVQEAFMEVWEKSNWIGTQKGLLIGPYLISVVKHKSITFYYQAARLDQKKSSYFLEYLLTTRTSKESEIIQSDKNKILRAIVSTLPARERECIQMRFLQEMSIEAIAIRLNISKKGVEKNITSGLKRLRKFKSSMY